MHVGVRLVVFLPEAVVRNSAFLRWPLSAQKRAVLFSSVRFAHNGSRNTHRLVCQSRSSDMHKRVVAMRMTY